ncbi:MAG: beta 1-4 rhamnosyltransferase Cps2T [Clostridium sp.]|uniref:beta 1-4 rhamnosyltransferase Cps2T n=1 Tax=Clostridium sp. TaxID=1506 RepID=UPI003F416170
MKHIFIIGSKGIPAKYGGFETFVDELTKNKKNEKIKYHVACMATDYDEFIYNEARCFNIKVANIGPAKAVYYDLIAIKKSIEYIEHNKIESPIIYILACRIGPFIKYFKDKIEALGGKMYVNPDGHEWKRAKWNCLIRKYWKVSERYMVKNADLLICDSKNIEKYIKEDYLEYKPQTKYIAYGAEVIKSKLRDSDETVLQWFKEKNVEKNEYYLIVGRFVPENNYELMIREFMKSKSKKDLVIITNVEENKFFNELKETTKFYNDERIKFVGTVYEQELLKKIRENAYGYIHGHEVGGTNPSLLEALATTKINLLLAVGFNEEVGEDGAIYFSKEEGNLAKVIDSTDEIALEIIEQIENKAKNIIKNRYSWEFIVDEYETLFLEKAMVRK